MNARNPNAPMIDSSGSMLQNWYDLDPQVWSWFCIPADIDIGIDENSVGLGSVALLNHPQYITRITHQIIGNTGNPEESGLYQDGQYSIEIKDQKTVFTLNAVQANNLLGPMIDGPFPDLGLPKYYQGVNTLQFRLTNLVNRTLSEEAETFRVQLAVHGVANLSIGGAR